MIDVSPKFKTLRYARAEGTLYATPEIIERIKNKTVPKGDVLQVARAAGILAAKRCADWIVFCHPMPLDWVDFTFEFEDAELKVIAEVKSVWKTGVEVEAVAGVTGALLNAYDMLKPFGESTSFGNIHVVEKKGGKSNFKDKEMPNINAAVLVISDSTFAGTRQDKSGKLIRQFLSDQNIEVDVYDVLPDNTEKIKTRLQKLADDENIKLIFTTGGTGFGPKDLTPEATRQVIEKEAPGVSETIRKYGKDRNPRAMLSRGLAGTRGGSLIINLPGSSNGAREGMQALFPGLLHIFPMMMGGGHPENDKNSTENKK